MPIVFARVDDRLIHGQIVQAWLPQLAKIDEVLLITETMHTINKNLLRLSLPYEYKLTIMDPLEAESYIPTTSSKLFLLFPSLKEVNKLLKKGVLCKSLNIGGMHYKENAHKFDDHLFLDAEDLEILKFASGLGIQIDTRSVPNAKTMALKEILL